jgi:hypothetical protein
MPGCELRANLDLVLGPWFPTGSTYAYNLAIPATPAALIGSKLFTQAATFSNPAVNTFGAITSNGIEGTLGSF